MMAFSNWQHYMQPPMHGLLTIPPLRLTFLHTQQCPQASCGPWLLLHMHQPIMSSSAPKRLSSCTWLCNTWSSYLDDGSPTPIGIWRPFLTQALLGQALTALSSLDLLGQVAAPSASSGSLSSEPPHIGSPSSLPLQHIAKGGPQEQPMPSKFLQGDPSLFL
ncbi:hypothetical protein L7F22_051680 [Adiantum nelumboides]|nr:hypothetical protein [Adiantum nelumboides]